MNNEDLVNNNLEVNKGESSFTRHISRLIEVLKI